MKLRSALPLSLAAAVLALSACSASESTGTVEPVDSAPASAPASSAPASEAPSSDAPSSEAPAGGNASLTIDGKEVELAEAPKCSSAAGKVSVSTSDGTVGAVIADGDSPSVDAFSYTNAGDGVSLAYLPSMGGKATATKDGDNWVIEGKATAATKSGTKEMEFKLTFSC